MNELIKTTQNENGEILVNARDLYKGLEIKKRFSIWWEQNSKMLIENEDFTSVLSGTVVNNGAVKPIQDYVLTLDAAKHIAMQSRTEKGKEVRQYFIQVEKMWNSPEMVIKRGYEALQLKVKEQQLLIGEQQAQLEISNAKIAEYEPKADYVDKILQCNGVMCVTQVATDYGMNARQFNALLHELGIQYKVNGQWILYTKHQNKGYIKTKTFEKNGKAYPSTYWTQKGRLFLYEELKHAGYMPCE